MVLVKLRWASTPCSSYRPGLEERDAQAALSGIPSQPPERFCPGYIDSGGMPSPNRLLSSTVISGDFIVSFKAVLDSEPAQGVSTTRGLGRSFLKNGLP